MSERQQDPKDRKQPKTEKAKAVDLYALDPKAIKKPPVGIGNTLKFLGPGLILVGSAVGSGELILTTTLGSAVGFSMLWWVLLSCWGKNIIQAELGRYTVSSGEPFLHAFNRLPGKLPGPKGKVSWFIYLWLFSIIPIHFSGGGIYGAAGQAVNMAFPNVESKWWTILLAVLASVLILTGTYRFLERLMTIMVVTFTFISVTCAILLQFTEYAITWSDLTGGFRFELPAFAITLALAMYASTGVGGGEQMSYTYWCIEKGYARFTGKRDGSDGWVERAKGWISVMQKDVLLTMLLLTVATISFYILGAGLLHKLNTVPDGLETVSIISNTFTHTLGQWAYWLFLGGAFLVLYSSVVSGLGGYARVFADGMIVLGLIDKNDSAARVRMMRAWAVMSPLIMSLMYFFVENPIWMLKVGNVFGTMKAPIYAAGAIYLRYTHVDRRIRPGWMMDVILWVCFLIMLVLGAYIFYLIFVR